MVIPFASEVSLTQAIFWQFRCQSPPLSTGRFHSWLADLSPLLSASSQSLHPHCGRALRSNALKGNPAWPKQGSLRLANCV